MQDHFFHHETRLYAGTRLADQSPREPGVYPLPAFATRSPLPEAVVLAPVPGTRDFVATLPFGKLLMLDGNGAWALLDIPPEPAVGNPPTPEPVELTFEERLKALDDAVQSALDATAKAFGYSSIDRAVSYADEPAVLKFQLEGQALRAWRSLVWAACYEILAEVQGGTRPEPTKEELLAELPLFVAPEIPALEEVEPEEPAAPEGNASEAAE